MPLGSAVRSNSDREQAIRVRLEPRDGTVVAVPNGPQGSHVITSLLGADALALIPAGTRRAARRDGGGARSATALTDSAP